MAGSQTAYDKKLAWAAEKSRENSRAGREIGPLPNVVDEERKESCRFDLEKFLTTYLGFWFPLEWADFHREMIKELQDIILHGGQDAEAKPRGSGKTTVGIGACIWAKCYGHRKYTVIIAASDPLATSIVEDSIKPTLSENELLLEDFPEVVYPIWQLEGSTRKCEGQLLNNQRTKMDWTKSKITFPTVKGSAASGSIIECVGVMGSLRGKVAQIDGKPYRPDFVFLDDPQTDQSAASQTETNKRMAIINGAVLGLSGPGQKIAAYCACTVIRPGDLADNLLDREKNPDWRGTKTPLMFSMPENEKLWDEYKAIREDDKRSGGTGQAATDFYISNRDAMDKGAKSSWPARYNDDEVSAIQNAMNLLHYDEVAFFAEYQNEPLTVEDDAQKITPDKLIEKLNGAKSGVIDNNIERLTMFIDVQGKALYYAVCGWDDKFGGQIVEWNTFPKQKAHSYSLRNLRQTFETVWPEIRGQEAQWFKALNDLTELQLSRTWTRSDGLELKITRCLIDCNDGNAQNTIMSVCRQSEYKSVITPADTISIGAGKRPIYELTNKEGTRLGLNWRQPPVEGTKPRKVQSDGNFWKSFVRERLLTPLGAESCLSINGNPKRASLSMTLLEDLSAERSVRTEGRGRVVDEWSCRPGLDNHYWDCVVGCAVGASMEGVKLPTADVEKKAIKSRMSRIAGATTNDKKNSGPAKGFFGRR